MTLSIPDLDLPQPKDVKKIIFVRIPKTGSTSVSGMLKQGGLVSFREIQFMVDYRTWKKHIGKHTFIFSTVRNPFSWLASAWNYEKYLRANFTFSEFVKIMCSDDAYKYFDRNKWHAYRSRAHPNQKASFMHIVINQNKTRSLFYALFNESGKCDLSVILRQEKLSKGVSYISDFFQKPFRKLASHKKRMKRNEYKSLYTQETREMVESYYKNDLEVFGYNFDGPIGGDIIIDPKKVSIRPFVFDNLYDMPDPAKFNFYGSSAPAAAPKKPAAKKPAAEKFSGRARGQPSVNGAKQSSKKTTRYIMVNGRKMKA